MKSIIATAALITLLAAGAAEVQVAASDECRQKCQRVENQCRMASKDLDSSDCAAKFLACLANCRNRR